MKRRSPPADDAHQLVRPAHQGASLGEELGLLTAQLREQELIGFDPWTATEAQARAGTAYVLDCETSEGAAVVAISQDPRSSLAQWAIANRLKDLAPSLAQWRPFDVLAAVALCVKHGLIVPTWLSDAFLKRYEAVAAMGSAALNDPESFGHPWPPGMQPAAERRRHAQMLEVASIYQQFRAKFPRAAKAKLWDAFTKRRRPTAAGQADEDDFGLGASLAARIRRLDIARSTAHELLDHYRERFGSEPRALQPEELGFLEAHPGLSAFEALSQFHAQPRTGLGQTVTAKAGSKAITVKVHSRPDI